MSNEKHRMEAIKTAREMIKLDPIYMDTETTGIDIFDEVIEIAILDANSSVLFEALIKPKKSIPASASAVHGITDITVAWAANWKAIWPEAANALKGRVLGMYNAEFDIKMLRQTCGLNGIPWDPPYKKEFCIMKLFAKYYGDWNSRRNSWSWKSLDFAGKHFGLPEPNSHRAKDDTILTRLILHKIAEG